MGSVGVRGHRGRSELQDRLPPALIGSLHGGVLSSQEDPLMGHCSGLMAVSLAGLNNFFPTVKEMTAPVCRTAEALTEMIETQHLSRQNGNKHLFKVPLCPHTLPPFFARPRCNFNLLFERFLKASEGVGLAAGSSD